MKKFYRNSMLMVAVTALFMIQSCQKEDDLNGTNDSVPELKNATMNTFYSSTVPIGNGVARAWVTQSKSGEPIAVGINLSEKALENLPDDPANYVFMFPKNKGNHFYQHALVDWNPQGHFPPGKYDVPHFDFHFYIIPNEERMAIEGSNIAIYPSSTDYIPVNYITFPEVVPEMGSHWIDTTSTELITHMNPLEGTFTKTFIWGSNNGEFIFWEPMITIDYFMNLKNMPVPEDESDVPQPIAYQKDGWYAHKYKISYSTKPGEYTIALTNLTFHNGQ